MLSDALPREQSDGNKHAYPAMHQLRLAQPLHAKCIAEAMRVNLLILAHKARQGLRLQHERKALAGLHGSRTDGLTADCRRLKTGAER